MHKFSLPAIVVLTIALLSGCKKGDDTNNTLIPHTLYPTVVISGPVEVSVQKYKDTVSVPFLFTSSDSTKQVEVKTVTMLSSDNDLTIRHSRQSGTTPFTDTVTIYPNPGATLTDYVRVLKVAYTTDSGSRALVVHVRANTDCSFLFNGHYSCKNIYPAAPGTFFSDITATGTNTGVMSNFANTGKPVNVTFNCGSELINIPPQTFDTSGTIHGSGGWNSGVLTINYTVFTGIFNYSGTVQASK